MRSDNTKNKKKRYRLNIGRFIIFLLVVALLIAGGVFAVKKLTGLGKAEGNETNTSGGAVDVAPEPVPKEPEYVDLTLRCVGDIMAHMPQVNAAASTITNSEGKKETVYDFSPSFEYVTKYLSEADLALGNVETTFSGDGSYSGYPGFDSPDILAKNIADTGIDVAFFANNHMLDSKVAGARRTVTHLRENGMTVVGARAETDENRSAVIDVKGVKIGLVAYTYETPLVNGKRTLNGSAGSGMNAGASDYINTFRYYKIEEDREAIKSEMDWCRENGAQIVIVYLHWGNEYWVKQSDADLGLAQFLAENGADIIFASHPHVVQKVDMVGNTPVFYSMGNFVSNQRRETLTETYGAETAIRTEQGMIACVDIKFCLDDGSFEFTKIGAIPTWVDRYSANGKTNYKIVPLVGELGQYDALKTSGHTKRAQDALDALTKLLGEEYLYY